MPTANTYRGIVADVNGGRSKVTVHSDTDAHAAALLNALMDKCDASWVGLEKEETLTVDSGTYTNFQASGKPVAGCTVKDMGQLFYGVQSRRQVLKVTIPAVVSTLLSPTNKRIGTDPIAGVGNLIDEEGVATTSFVRGKFAWNNKRKS